MNSAPSKPLSILKLFGFFGFLLQMPLFLMVGLHRLLREPDSPGGSQVWWSLFGMFAVIGCICVLALFEKCGNISLGLFWTTPAVLYWVWTGLLGGIWRLIWSCYSGLYEGALEMLQKD